MLSLVKSFEVTGQEGGNFLTSPPLAVFSPQLYPLTSTLGSLRVKGAI